MEYITQPAKLQGTVLKFNHTVLNRTCGELTFKSTGECGNQDGLYAAYPNEGTTDTCFVVQQETILPLVSPTLVRQIVPWTFEPVKQACIVFRLIKS